MIWATEIAASMVEFGWTNPVLVDEHGGVLAGHGRLMAARKLGLTEARTVYRAADRGVRGAGLVAPG